VSSPTTLNLLKTAGFAALACWPLVGRPASIPSPAELEAAGATIGTIRYAIKPIFDTDDERESGWFYRQINRFHITTRESVVATQVIFHSGEPFEQRKLDETARLLRQNRYLHDARVRITGYQDGKVDITVTTTDIWTLTPGLSITRSGGENRTKFELEDLNLLGTGAALTLQRAKNVDRRSSIVRFSDRNLGQTWVRLDLEYADSDDGNTLFTNLQRPFYALDSRWSAGIQFFDGESDERLFSLGREAASFHRERRFVDLFGGWSAGLQGNWVRRYFVGVTLDEAEFSPQTGSALPTLLPTNRKLIYPWVGFELLENRFLAAENLDQIGRTEDLYLGSRISARVGWSGETLGAEQDGLMYSAVAQSGFGSPQRHMLLVNTALSGRRTRSGNDNALASAQARYFYRHSEKSLAFASLTASRGKQLDIDNLQIVGGNTGLRGYPLRYQSGDSRAVITLEQRYFTDWYPFRLVRVGGAVFFDAGRTWGTNPVDEQNFGWLKNIGVGLRLGSTRGLSSKTIHLDLAFPLDGDNSIDDVQVLLEAKQTF
jgi:hypothetical protein